MSTLQEISKEISEVGDVDVRKIENDFNDNTRFLREKRTEYERIIVQIGETGNEIKRLEGEIQRLASATGKNKRIQNCIRYSKALFQWFDDAYQKREKEVNLPGSESTKIYPPCFSMINVARYRPRPAPS